jgi:hypothetical protein
MFVLFILFYSIQADLFLVLFYCGFDSSWRLIRLFLISCALSTLSTPRPTTAHILCSTLTALHAQLISRPIFCSPSFIVRQGRTRLSYLAHHRRYAPLAPRPSFRVQSFPIPLNSSTSHPVADRLACNVDAISSLSPSYMVRRCLIPWPPLVHHQCHIRLFPVSDSSLMSYLLAAPHASSMPYPAFPRLAQFIDVLSINRLTFLINTASGFSPFYIARRCLISWPPLTHHPAFPCLA